ncbi:DUF2304 domain-containing protein [Candidatus Pelagibacter sp.]|jgi:hypothetical protein|nr:DUF2304 domain-containing protein [Candidatus Pelagibacter sp.]
MLTLQSRLIAFVIGLILISVIFFLVKKKHLDHLYSSLWIFIGIFFISVSFFPYILNIISNLLGIEFKALGVLVFSIFGLGAILLHLSIIITQHQRKIKEYEKKISLIENKFFKN